MKKKTMMKHEPAFFAVKSIFIALAISSAAQAQSDPMQPHNSLDALISGAIKSHPTLQAGAEQQAAANSNLSAVGQQLLPRLSAEMTPITTEQAGEKPGATVSLRQPIWILSGTELPSCRAAVARTLEASWAVEEAREALVLRVISTYANWMGASKREEISKADVAYYSTLRSQIERRVASGASPKIELNLVVAREISARNDMADSSHNEQNFLKQLEQMSGISISRKELKSTIMPQTNIVGELSDLESKIVARSPSLTRMALEVEALEYDRQARKEQAMPKLYVEGSHTFGGDKDSSVAFMGVEWLPGPGISDLSGIDTVAHQRAAAKSAREAALFDLLEKIRTNYNQLLSAQEQWSLQDQNISSLEMVRDSYLRQFLVGRRSWQEVMNSAKEVSDANKTAADLHTRIFSSGYTLDYLTGGHTAEIANANNAVHQVDGICAGVSE